MQRNKKAYTLRKYMVGFRFEDGSIDFLMLHATNLKDALKLAECVAGPSAASALCFKDFLIYD